MDTPMYVLEFLVRERLASAEAWAARQALAAAHRAPRVRLVLSPWAGR